MFSVARRKYLDWMLTGVVGTSVVMAIYYSSKTTALSAIDICSASLLSSSIPMSIFSLLISKEAELYKVCDSKVVDGGHAILFILSIVLFSFGFILFIFGLGWTIFGSVCVSIVFSLLVYTKVKTKIIEV